MKHFRIAFLLLLAIHVSVPNIIAQNPPSIPLPDTPQEWLAAPHEPSEFKDQAKAMQSLAEKLFSQSVDKTPPPQNIIDWLTLGQWLDLYSPKYPIFQSPKKTKAFISLLKTQVPYLFLTYRSTKDITSEALDILCRLQIHAPDDVKEFSALAVAFSIVHDAPFPKTWPHHQVNQGDLPKGDYSIESHFDFLVSSQRKNKLMQDLSGLNVSQLKFVVDSKVPLSELEWAQKNVKASRSRYEDAFLGIRYDQPRLAAGQFNWPNGEYTLSAIQSQGGICVDQAYFACISGKAKGLPTLYFSGQGSQGGHAWFGFLRTADRWELDGGRYSNQNYCVGYAYDPQTWDKINDSQLKQLTDKVEDEPNYIPIRFIFNWLEQNPASPSYATTIDLLREAIPTYVPFWRASAQKEIFDSKSDDNKIAFWEKWISQFDNSPDIKVEGQEELSKLYEKLGKTDEAAELKRQIISQNKRKRFDIGIESESQNLQALVDGKNYDEAEDAYQRIIRNYDDKAGGMLIYKIIIPYISSMIDTGETKRAIDAYKYASKHLKAEPDSIVAQKMLQIKLAIEQKNGSKIK